MYDESRDTIEEPADDGGRHRLWVRHDAKARDFLHRTAIGGVFDLGRLVNFVADFVDYRVEPRLPPVVWSVPLAQKLYNVLVPPEDENQVRCLGELRCHWLRSCTTCWCRQRMRTR